MFFINTEKSTEISCFGIRYRYKYRNTATLLVSVHTGTEYRQKYLLPSSAQYTTGKCSPVALHIISDCLSGALNHFSGALKHFIGALNHFSGALNHISGALNHFSLYQ